MKRAIVVTPSSGYLLPYEAACKLLELLADAEVMSSSYDTVCGFTRVEPDRYNRINLQPISITDYAEIELAMETKD